MAQATDIRIAWPDLAKATPEALARRSAAIDEALAEGRGQAPPGRRQGGRPCKGGRAARVKRGSQAPCQHGPAALPDRLAAIIAGIVAMVKAPGNSRS